MPHRPSTNPIPRFSSNNVAPNSPEVAPQFSGDPSEYVLSHQHERESLPPRHRPVSWSSNPTNGRERSKSNAASSAASTTSNPSGRSGGRALPPPRFQRKQRPPRVHQALATANSASGNSSSSQPQAKSRRGNIHTTPAGGPIAGPPGNRPGGSNALVSLSMAEVNAASARGSVIHHSDRQAITVQETTPLVLPYTTSVYDPITAHSTLEFQNLDPVQLHNRITFGMGNQAVSALFPSHSTEQINSSLTSPGHIDSGGYLPESSYQLLNFARLRSQSHSSVPHNLQPDSDVSNANFVLGGYPGIMSDEPLLRTRSQSLIIPAEMGAHSSQQSTPYPLPSAYATPTTLDQVDGPLIESPTARVPVLTNVLVPSTSPKPLKSVLKSRKTVPFLVNAPAGISPSLKTSISYTSEGYDNNHPFHSDKSNKPAGRSMDAEYSLPDTLQAQYAEQLRLLQQEYAVKAAKAERSRQRSAERVKSNPDSGIPPASKDTLTPSADSVPNEFTDVAGEEEHVISHGVVDVPVKNPFQDTRHHITQAIEGYDSWDEDWKHHQAEHSTVRTNRSRALSDATSAGISGAEDDVGSDIGDRGHGETEMAYFRDDLGSRRIFSDSTRSRSLSSLVSHIASGLSAASSSPMASPSGAIYHGVDPPSPSTSSLTSPILSGIQVEVIAPTPLTQSKELDPEDSMGDVINSPSNPGVIMSEVTDSSLPGPSASPRTSAESSGSSDSNNTIIRESITKLLEESPEDLYVPPIIPAVSSLPVANLHLKQHTAQIQVNPPYTPSQLHGQNDRGMSYALPNYQAAPVASSQMYYSTLPVQSPIVSTAQYHTSANEPPFTPIEHISTQGATFARRLSSMPSISSVTSTASSSRASATRSSSSNVRAPPHQRVDVLRPKASSQDVASVSSHTNSTSAFDESNLSPRSAFAHRTLFSNIDLSSSASVESGSSYGGNSGVSHLSRPHERPLVGSLVSHQSGSSSSDTHPRGTRNTARQLPRSDVVDTAPDSFALGKRYALDDDSSSVRNMELMDSSNKMSGKRSTVGSILPAGRTFGGGSIWTLGRDEEAQWLPITTQSRERSEVGALEDAPRPYQPDDALPGGLSTMKPKSSSASVALSDISPVYPNPASQRFADSHFSTLRPQHSSPAFATPTSGTSGEVISVLLHPHELEQLKALRAAQVYGQTTQPPRPPPVVSPKGYLSQVTTRSLPSMGLDTMRKDSSLPSVLTNDQMSALGRPPASDFTSRPSTAVTGRSSHSGDSGESGGRRSIVALPASGGVFPRYQEFSTPSFESLPRAGSSRGRFKSLFRGRDSRVFK